MKLGTLRFSRQHRAARARRRWNDLYGVPITDVRLHYPKPPIKPGDLGVLCEQVPSRHRSWWERVVGKITAGSIKP